MICSFSTVPPDFVRLQTCPVRTRHFLGNLSKYATLFETCCTYLHHNVLTSGWPIVQHGRGNAFGGWHVSPGPNSKGLKDSPFWCRDRFARLYDKWKWRDGGILLMISGVCKPDRRAAKPKTYEESVRWVTAEKFWKRSNEVPEKVM